MSELVVTFFVNAMIQTTFVAIVTVALSRMLHGAAARILFNLVAVSIAVAVAAPLASLLPRSADAPMPQTHAVTPPLNATGADALTILYLSGLAIALARLAYAAIRTRRLISRSQPFEGQIRISDDIRSPISIGSVIIIPRALAGSELLPAALEHERAHVRRRDFALNALLEAVSLPLYFHPGMMLLRRKMAELRELACDEEAVQRIPGRSYAAALIRLASFAACPDALAVGMASTSIERRISAVQKPQRSKRASRVAAGITVALPFALLFACSRVSVTPSFVHSNLCGVWKLIPAASDFHALQPQRFDEYTQWIAQGPRGVSVRQHRVAKGRAEDTHWSVITDGAWRGISGLPGARGKATWTAGRLTLVMAGPGSHREYATAFVDDNRLVCQGTTERGQFRAVFQRAN